MFHTYQVIFSDIFALFLAQNFKTKVLTAQKKSTFRVYVLYYTKELHTFHFLFHLLLTITRFSPQI